MDDGRHQLQLQQQQQHHHHHHLHHHHSPLHPDNGVLPESVASSQSGQAEQYSHFPGLTTVPTRWHPDYALGADTSPHVSHSSHLPRSASNDKHPPSFLSPIPEHPPSLRYLYSGVNGSDGFRAYNAFSGMGINSQPAHDRRYSETDLLRVPRFVKRGRKEAGGPGRRTLGGGGVRATLTHSLDDSLSQSSEGYGSTHTLQQQDSSPNSFPHGNRTQGSLESTSDSESLEWKRDSGRNFGGRRHSTGDRFPRRSAPVEITLQRPSSPSDLQSESSRDELQKQPSTNRRQKGPHEYRTSKSPSSPDLSSRPSINPVNAQRELPRSHRRFSSSTNSVRRPSSGNSSRLESSDSSRRTEADLNTNRSQVAKSSASSSRQQSIFGMGGTAISAEMVSTNPSAAARLAFASFDVPQGLLPTISKQFRDVCRPMMTCLLLVILAASLAAAIYFAVVLNKTQTEHIEYLRARLNFFINQTSQDSLTSMSMSERTMFEEQYCKEINAYYQDSELSESYRGCEVASVKGDTLSVLLYFDHPATGGPATANRTEDVILQVLASSAPRIGQQEDGVISVNNVPLQLSRVEITVEQTSQTPRVAKGDSSRVSVNSEQATSTQLQTETTMASPQQPISCNSLPASSSHKSFYPCAPGESGTYHRHPGSCSIFLQCLDGRPITLSCGSGVFDMDRKVCVEAGTDCEEACEEAQFYADVAPEDLQPCEFKGGDFHPHPRICNLYFQCTAVGTSVKGVCPDRLVFSAQYQTCVLLDSNFQCPQIPTSQNNDNSNSDMARNEAREFAPATRNMAVTQKNIQPALWTSDQDSKHEDGTWDAKSDINGFSLETQTHKQPEMSSGVHRPSSDRPAEENSRINVEPVPVN